MPVSIACKNEIDLLGQAERHSTETVGDQEYRYEIVVNGDYEGYLGHMLSVTSSGRVVDMYYEVSSLGIDIHGGPMSLLLGDILCKLVGSNVWNREEIEPRY